MPKHGTMEPSRPLFTGEGVGNTYTIINRMLGNKTIRGDSGRVGLRSASNRILRCFYYNRNPIYKNLAHRAVSRYRV